VFDKKPVLNVPNPKSKNVDISCPIPDDNRIGNEKIAHRAQLFNELQGNSNGSKKIAIRPFDQTAEEFIRSGCHRSIFFKKAVRN
jgi:hypothetical protein